MLFQSRRFIEYFPAFALVFAAFAWVPVLQGSQTITPARLKGSLLKSLPALALLLVALAGGWPTFQAAQASLGTSRPYQTYAGASAWLVEHTPAGARVFQTDWDDFPRLFFYNTHNTYLIGLDPTYMSIYDADLYERWVAITRGKVARPSATIAADFGAGYVLTDLQHRDFLKQAAQDPGLWEVYRDQDAIVFQIAISGE
jgi:hypothetical protein